MPLSAGFWCLKIHEDIFLAHTFLQNVDGSRGSAVVLAVRSLWSTSPSLFPFFFYLRWLVLVMAGRVFQALFSVAAYLWAYKIDSPFDVKKFDS